jgi:hypothetical protein
MKKIVVLLCVMYLIFCMVGTTIASTITVPGTSDIWLAGMPNGSTASLTDSAPDQSPVLVSSISLTAGDLLAFSNATGCVANNPTWPCLGPDGGEIYHHETGTQNGISDVYAPLNSLLGIFLNDSQPNLSGAPSTLYFDSGTSIDNLTFSPALKQVFFIGNGLTSGGVQQSIVVPTGATRLYLGTMDGSEWSNNVGSFSIEIGKSNQAVPEPATILLLGLGLIGLVPIRKRLLK